MPELPFQRLDFFVDDREDPADAAALLALTLATARSSPLT
jgi:hypothetical protein